MLPFRAGIAILVALYSTTLCANDDSFATQILPILKQHCYECHSHEAGEASGRLVLDSRSGWANGGESGPAIVPGAPDESLLIKAIRYVDEDLSMPPDNKLPAEVITRIERWVSAGADDPRVDSSVRTHEGIDLEAGRQHWAFQPIDGDPPPDVADEAWPLSDVDHYVLARLEANGLGPVADADRYTWLRRISFDLTGLPPTAEEIRQFESDHSSKAYERVVDRLLDSSAFGERWARHWLDLVGYADQIGTSNSVFAAHAWRYRDYVIAAYNNDAPFDQFIRQQIAGDLLPYDSVEERATNLTATGFLVLGDIAIVEADKAKLVVDIVDQQVNKTGRAFLAMTVDCARCHDHKFDPISQRDYYALAGFFHSTSSIYKTERGVWSDVHLLDLPETSEQQEARAQQEAEHAQQLLQLKSERDVALKRISDLDKALGSPELEEKNREVLENQRAAEDKLATDLAKKIEHAEFFHPIIPKAHGVMDVDEPGDMQITIRGNPRALGEEVPRGFLSVISDARPEIDPSQSGRRQLAEWIAHSSNPLTARVAVNRIWQKLFGEGLVRSVDYFGTPGERPTHPELLDFLAARFVAEGWSQKRIIRSLVLSRTYRLASTHNEESIAVDPENRLLWRMNRVRLDAEALRDAMIAAGGKLTSLGGPSMPLEFPENVGGINPKSVNPPSFSLKQWRPEQEFERTVYLPVIRHSGQPGPGALRNVFDFPQPSQFAGRRSTTAVPTQALFLMNSPVVKKHATALARRVVEVSAHKKERLAFLWLTLLNRPITELEQQESIEFLNSGGENGWAELCHALLASTEFLMRT